MLIFFFFVIRGSQGVQTIIQLTIANENVGVRILNLILSYLIIFNN